jgi:hypothetical protein
MRFFFSECSWQFTDLFTYTLENEGKVIKSGWHNVYKKMLSFWNNLHHVHAQCQNIESETI